MMPDDGEQKLMEDLSNLSPGGRLLISSSYRVERDRANPWLYRFKPVKEKRSSPKMALDELIIYIKEEYPFLNLNQY